MLRVTSPSQSATRVGAAVLALLAVLVYLASPLHVHSDTETHGASDASHASAASCAVCHLVHAPVLAPIALPSISTAGATPHDHASIHTRFCSHAAPAATGRGPPPSHLG
jgi:hypothetical protein